MPRGSLAGAFKAFLIASIVIVLLAVAAVSILIDLGWIYIRASGDHSFSSVIEAVHFSDSP